MIFGPEYRVWAAAAGILLLGLSMFVVNRFDLQRKGLFAPLTPGGANRLPTLVAMGLGIAGGILVFYGLRAS
jgi:hypothetical protein